MTHITLTQRLVTLLRENSTLEQNLILYDGAKEIERGRIDIGLKFEPSTIEQIVEEDVRKIEDLYFDPFVESQAIISQKV